MIFVSKSYSVRLLLVLSFSFLPNFSSHCPAPTRVGERLIKSKNIPEQARAFASALKQAVVKPLKRSINKKKSLDTTAHEHQLLRSHPPPPLPIVQSLSNLPSTYLTNSDHHLNELSVDSYESTSLMAITPPPAKPPRQNEESSSSSSMDIHSPPPAKPPRHFSVYKTVDELNALRQTTTDQFVRIQTSESLKQVEPFTVQPIRVAVKTDVPLRTESFAQSPVTISTKHEQSFVEKYATNLTDEILHQSKKQIHQSNRERLLNKLSQLEQQQQQEEEKTSQSSGDIPSSFPRSMVTTHISPNHSTKRPVMFLPFDSNTHFLPTNKRSPLLEIVTIKPTPTFKTSVTVTSSSSSSSLASSSTPTITNSVEDLIRDTSTFIPTTDHQQSKRTSIDSHDLTSYDNNLITGNETPSRSLHSDYDNIHGSYGSLIDDNQTPRLPSPSTVSSSMTTIYESLDNFPSSASTTTSRTYVSAVSTFNTGGTRTPSQRLNSDISDEDLVELWDIERSSQGRMRERETKHETIHHIFLLACHCPSFHGLFSQQLAWRKISFASRKN